MVAEDELVAVRAENSRLRAELDAFKKRERALSHELQHRVRNMLAVIRTIYRRSREGGASQELFAEHFEGRLGALARYQTYVDVVGSGIDLEDLVRNELLNVHCLDGPHFSIEGVPVLLRQKAAELIGLAVHELATNSIKFGALAHGGRLRVTWLVENEGATPQLRFSWTEMGISVASAAPRPSGFGRQLIEDALPYQLGATTSFELKPGIFECTIALPLPEPTEANHESIALLMDDQSSLPTEME